FPLYSRTFFARLIDEACITINGQTINKQSLLIKPDDSIAIMLPQPTMPSSTHDRALIQSLPISIVYEHEHFLILNKPANLMIHKPTKTSTVITLVDWLVSCFSDIASV